MNEDIAYFAKTRFRNQEKVFGIKSEDRRRHLYVLGATGVGKSNLLKTLLIDDIQNGRGCTIIDPHGELAEDLLEYIPPWRTDHVVYFNPADVQHPIGLNLLEKVPPDSRPLVASSVISALKGMGYRQFFGPRMEHILYACLLSLQYAEGQTILGVNRMLTDSDYRDWVVRQVSARSLQAFWFGEFENYSKQQVSEYTAPILNKVGRLLNDPRIRLIVSQPKSSMGIRFMMDEKRILIANLSRGKLGEDASDLLGSLLITQFYLAAISRVDTPEEERVDHFLFVDEFYNFGTSVYTSILSEARKFRLSLSLSHQFLDQLSDEVKAAVFGNAGSVCCFRLGQRDAEIMAKELAPVFTEEDLISLNKYEICLSLLIDGLPSKAFSATTLPPIGRRYNRGETIKKSSREKYGRPREILEDKLERWWGNWQGDSR